ncbi:MAG: hypothetical protein AB7S48_14905 [Bacteroidales bacterium]
MEKVLLLIDDSQDHIGVLDNIKTHLRSNESIDLVTKYINPNDRAFWNTEKDPDLDMLITGIQFELKTLKPNLIVVDQFYGSNEKFKGIDVIQKLREVPKFQKCSFIIISGRREQIVRDIFEKEGITNSKKVNNLAKLINLKIDSFLDKDFKSEAIHYLKQSKLDEILPSKLREFEGENIVINSFSPAYNTLTFSELADKIEGDAPDAKDILDELFGLTLSHYVSINEKL